MSSGRLFSPRPNMAVAGLVLAWLGAMVVGGWPSCAVADLIGHGGMVRAVDVSPDGRQVVTGSFDYTARLWDFGTQTEIAVLDGHDGPVTSASFLPDGKRVITTSDDGKAIIWDVATAKPVMTLVGHTFKVMTAAVSADGKIAATGSWDKTVRLWDLASGKVLRVIKQSAPVNGVAFVRGTDGAQWVAAGGHDGKIGLWNVADGKLEGRLEGHRLGITQITASPDGRRLLSASIDKTLRLWDVPARKELMVLKHGEGRTGQVYAVAMSPDGKRALSAGKDGRLELWDLATGKILRTIVAHDTIVWAVDFTPDGRFAVTGSSDENARVWHLATGDRIGLTGDEKDTPKPWLESSHPGAKLFTKCAKCHALHANGIHRSGPHFEGLWGRKVGSVAGYNYSDALKNKDFSWNAKTLYDLFHRGPDKVLPGTKMPVQRVPDDKQLHQLVDYLRVLTGPDPDGEQKTQRQ